MTLTDAAMVLGIARQTLINLETGKGGSIDTALRAAREFGVAILAVPGGRQGAVRRALESVMQPGQPTTPAELTDGQP